MSAMNETPEGFKQYYLFDHPVQDSNEFEKATAYNTSLKLALENIPDAKGKTYYVYTASKSPRLAGVVEVKDQDRGSCTFTFTPQKISDSKLTPYTNEKLMSESDAETLKRTKEDIIKEHLKTNAMAYNGIIYIPEYMEQVKKLFGYPIFDFFYPSVKIFIVEARKATSLGGTYNNSSYSEKANWYKVAVRDEQHNSFAKDVCKLIEALFSGKDIVPEDLDVATEWMDEVDYHCRLLMEAEPYSKEYLYECQYLHDLFWDPFDDPLDSGVIAQNIIAFVRNIDPSLIGNLNEHDGLITKEALLSYIKDEISDPSIYLIPEKKEYPILDKSSLKLAMDSILDVDDSDLKKFTTNLNKRMKDLNFPYKIPADHPYAKYAPKEMVLHIMMMEGAK